MTDEGLFGPDSVTWRVQADPSMVLAGLRALLLQTLHPLAMAGVAQHSDFRGDPWGRLFRTAEYVAVTTYGTTAEAERAGARVRGIHRRVIGTERESGLAYRASDPELLRWVHVVEVESFLSTAVRCGVRLTADDQDRYYDEQRASATLVGLDPATVPGSVAQVQAYYDDVRPQLRATGEARRGVRVVLAPPMPNKVRFGTPAQPAWASMAGIAFGMMPRWARRQLGLPGLPTTDLVATASGVAVRAALLAIPSGVRTGPELKKARARLAA